MGHADVVIALRDGIVTALRADHTAGGGTYDLSATDAVQVGRAFSPPGSSAFVAVATPTLAGSEDGRTLNQHAYKASVDIRGWAPVADDTPEARSDAALELAADIANALQVARYESGGALKGINGIRGIEEIGLMDVGGEEWGVPSGWASCFVTVVFAIVSRRGL